MRDPAAEEKDRAEAEWERELFKLFQGQVTRIEAELEPAIPDERKAAQEPTDILDEDFWANEEALFLSVIVPLLTAAAQNSIATETAILESSFDISMDWTLANAEAAAWARQHGGELVTAIMETTARSVGETVATWIETPGSTVGELFETLRQSYTFSQSRSHNIGVTEVTNAYAEGHELAYIESGIPIAVFKPTAHPNCRCWDTAALLPDSTWVIVWRTNMDELVCKRPIPTGTALGTVAGCRELENMVVSAGPFLGEKLSEARRATKEVV
jgi:hypothetical protein